MRHGYTNHTAHAGAFVVKTYAGPDAIARQRTERRSLISLAGVLPIPEVVADERGELVTRFVPGRHGQDLVDEGHAADVLASCGRVLRTLHAVDPGVVFGAAAGPGEVVVHGDFGPNNVLFVDAGRTVAAVLDWEFCHPGAPIEDLAWCEWIIRAHHSHAVAQLPELFDSYGWTPSWADRVTAMRARCRSLEKFCREWDPTGAGVESWIARREELDAWRA